MEVSSLGFDAVVLAGGKSSRLGGTPKQSLVFQGQTLLERAVAAAAGAGLTVVVGDTDFLPNRPPVAQPLPAWPATLLTCREEPRFAGPAAAIAAGLEALAAHHAGTGNAGGAPYTLVLACDMPSASQAVAALLDALGPSMERASGGVMACAEDGRAQPLAGFYRTSELTKACKALAARDALVNGSVRALLASLDVQLVTVPAGSTADVDTWDDVAALGIAAGNQHEGQDRHSGGTNVGGNS